jgi:hypothetical protein
MNGYHRSGCNREGILKKQLWIKEERRWREPSSPAQVFTWTKKNELINLLGIVFLGYFYGTEKTSECFAWRATHFVTSGQVSCCSESDLVRDPAVHCFI